MSLPFILISLLVGVMIGAVGIGGVLLVPALAFLIGIPIHEAIPACMLSYVASGAVGAAIYAKHGSIVWRMSFWVCLGAIPGAFLGASALLYFPASVLKFLIGLLMIAAGLNALRTGIIKSPSQKLLPPLTLMSIGLVTGVGSALSGTGGPLILVPLAFWLGLPVLTAVGLSQIIQIPIAIFASIGNLLQGNLNINLGVTIAIVMSVGVLIGATLVHRIPTAPLKNGISYLLVVIGIGIIIQIGTQFLST